MATGLGGKIMSYDGENRPLSVTCNGAASERRRPQRLQRCRQPSLPRRQPYLPKSSRKILSRKQHKPYRGLPAAETQPENLRRVKGAERSLRAALAGNERLCGHYCSDKYRIKINVLVGGGGGVRRFGVTLRLVECHYALIPQCIGKITVPPCSNTFLPISPSLRGRYVGRRYAEESERVVGPRRKAAHPSGWRRQRKLCSRRGCWT